MPALAYQTLSNNQNHDKCMTWDSLRIYDLLVTGQHVLPLATTISRYIDLLLFQLQSSISY